MAIVLGEPGRHRDHGTNNSLHGTVSVESDSSKCEEPSTYKTFFSEGLVQQGGAINDSIRTSKSELYEQVGTKPMSKLARRYGISDVGHAKIFKKHDIPRPSRGYWARKQAGQKLQRKPSPVGSLKNMF